MASFHKDERKGVGSPYGKLKVQLSDHLTQNMVDNLMRLFRIIGAEKERIMLSVMPALSLLNALEAKALFDATNVQELELALIQSHCHATANVIVKYRLSQFPSPVPMKRSPFQKRKVLLQKSLRREYKSMCKQFRRTPWETDRSKHFRRSYVSGRLTRLDAETDKLILLQDFNDLFEGDHLKDAKRIVIEGGTGVGKSTLMLKIADEWCSPSENSPLKDVEFLIILKMKDIDSSKSIYLNIKDILLEDISLSEVEICELLNSGSSIVLAFDGYHEFVDMSCQKSDVWKIFKEELLPEIKVLVTSQSLCISDDVPFERVKMEGFTDDQKLVYIQSVFPDDHKMRKHITNTIEDNPAIADLCQVPLFLSVVVGFLGSNSSVTYVATMTGFFNLFYNTLHLAKSPNARIIDKTCLEDFALENICLPELGEKADVRRRLLHYDHWISNGILKEERVTFTSVELSKRPLEGAIEAPTNVLFYHKLLQEYFAAGALSRCLTKKPQKFDELLRKIEPTEFLLRFTCGLNADAIGPIMKYLATLEDDDISSIRSTMFYCFAEYTGDKNQLKEVVANVCKWWVQIHDRDGRLLQQIKVDMLKLASDLEIPIREVIFNNTICEVLDDKIKLKSGVYMPNLSTVKQYVMREYDNTIHPSMVNIFIAHVLKSDTVTDIAFQCPADPPPEIHHNTQKIIKRKTALKMVAWVNGNTSDVYNFNKGTGKWVRGTLAQNQSLLNTLSKIQPTEADIWPDPNGPISFEKVIIQPVPLAPEMMDNDEVYAMNSRPRGLALIINNQKFCTMRERWGTEVDAKNLAHVFEQVGFNVETKNDQEGQEMMNTVKMFTRKDHSNFDCVILAILTHGTKDILYGTDEKEVKVEDLLEHFDGSPSLIGKPKIIILQACRGEKEDEGNNSTDAPGAGNVEETARSANNDVQDPDSIAEQMLQLEFDSPDAFPSSGQDKVPSRCDMLIAYATIPGFVSWRHSKRGSWFIQALTEVILEYANREDLSSMLTRVNAKVAKAPIKKQMPAPVNMLTKKLFFFPGHYK